MLRLPALTVLAYSLSVVDLALIIGPSLPPPLAVLVDRWFNDPDLSMRLVGAAGATLLFLLISMLIGIFLLAERGVVMLTKPRLINGVRRSPWSPMKPGARLAAAAILGTSCLCFFLLVAWSITGSWRFPDAYPHTFSLFYWSKSLPLVAQPLATAAVVGFFSASIARHSCHRLSGK